MLSLALANWKAILVGSVILVISAFGLYQKLGWELCKTEYAQFRADVDRLASEAKVKNAQEAARHALNAQETLDALQTRYTSLNARYSRLRDAGTSGGSLPALSSAAPLISACPSGQPDAAARFLGEVESRFARILEEGDREIAKYRELWTLNLKNAGK